MKAVPAPDEGKSALCTRRRAAGGTWGGSGAGSRPHAKGRQAPATAEGRGEGSGSRAGPVREAPGARRADVGAATSCARQTTQERRQLSKDGIISTTALAGPLGGPSKMPSEMDLKSFLAYRRLIALAAGNGNKVKWEKRALTVHSLPHRVQIRRRCRRRPGTAAARHGGGRGRREKGLTRNWSAFLSPGQSHHASPAHAGQAPPLALVASVRLR